MALDVSRGVCFGLNEVGLRILQMLESPASVEDICGDLLAVYEVDRATCEADVVALLADLEAEGLIHAMNGMPAG